ncbi:MAG: DUF5011 domain-containing protein [Epsilonproteobacteria bacterium]|nr:DUF5011 domain-containing protein [Campylobacterota bacterium]
MIKFLTIIFFLTITLNATIYEDAEDKTTKRWSIYNNVSDATIKNIYDKKKKSRVIALSSDDSRTGFMISLERDSKTWCQSDGKSLHWSMKTNNDFVIFISLQTKNGHRSLVYTASAKNGSGYYGLGKNSRDGTWHNYTRDLDLDLRRYEPSNRIIAVDTFFIRGNAQIDDLKITDIKDKSKKKFVAKKSKNCEIYVPKLNNGIEMDINDAIPPVIKLNGYPTVYIKLGAEYIEKGATAKDNVDGDLNVEVSGTVDGNRVGTYTLFYMAKDRVGNTSITTRVVNVGLSQKANQIPKTDKNIEEKKEKEKNIKSVKRDTPKPPLTLEDFRFDEDELLLQELEAQE